MSQPKFPAGWDANRVERLIDHYQSLSEDEQVAEDDTAGEEKDGQVVVTVPQELLPAIRELLAKNKSA